MGSFDKVRALLNEVTLQPGSMLKQYNKRHAARQAKMSGMMGAEPPKPTEKKRSQLLKVGSKAHKAAKKVNANTEILAVLQSLKESYESGQITEAAFLKLAQPIIEKFGSAGDARNNPAGQPKSGEKPPKKLKLKAPKQKKGLKWKENDSSSFGSKADRG